MRRADSHGLSAAPAMVKAQYVLEPRHVQALRAAALERAESGGRMDASAVLRDILDGWMKKRAR